MVHDLAWSVKLWPMHLGSWESTPKNYLGNRLEQRFHFFASSFRVRHPSNVSDGARQVMNHLSNFGQSQMNPGFVLRKCSHSFRSISVRIGAFTFRSLLT